MIKRMFISVALLGLAAFAMGGAAMAYFTSTPATADVAISTDTPELGVTVDVNCDGSDEVEDVSSYSGDLDWHDIVPGNTTQDCFTIHNESGHEFDTSLSFSSVTGNTDLRNAVEFRVITDGASNSSFAPVEHPAFNGFELGTIADGGEIDVRVEARFPSNGDQSDLAGKGMNFVTTLTGQTTGN